MWISNGNRLSYILQGLVIHSVDVQIMKLLGNLNSARDGWTTVETEINDLSYTLYPIDHDTICKIYVITRHYNP